MLDRITHVLTRFLQIVFIVVSIPVLGIATWAGPGPIVMGYVRDSYTTMTCTLTSAEYVERFWIIPDSLYLRTSDCGEFSYQGALRAEGRRGIAQKVNSGAPITTDLEVSTYQIPGALKMVTYLSFLGGQDG